MMDEPEPTVEVLAIVAKKDAARWLEREGRKVLSAGPTETRYTKSTDGDAAWLVRAPQSSTMTLIASRSFIAL